MRVRKVPLSSLSSECHLLIVRLSGASQSVPPMDSKQPDERPIDARVIG